VKGQGVGREQDGQGREERQEREGWGMGAGAVVIRGVRPKRGGEETLTGRERKGRHQQRECVGT
jgi:hypothetical protein